MKNECIMNYDNLLDETIKTFMENHPDTDEITCLVPKEDKTTGELLSNHGFRYIGKRLVNNHVMIVYKWFREPIARYENMASFFDLRAEDYDVTKRDEGESYEISLSQIASNITLTDDSINILDLGCGTGAELKHIFQRAPYAQIVCVDVSTGMLHKLQKTYNKYRKNIETICKSYLGMDFGSKRFDYVISCDSFHHILKEDKASLYMNIKNSLKESGVLLISDYIASEEEECEFRNDYFSLLENSLIQRNEVYHIDLGLSENTEKVLLKEAGFNNVSLRECGERTQIVAHV